MFHINRYFFEETGNVIYERSTYFLSINNKNEMKICKFIIQNLYQLYKQNTFLSTIKFKVPFGT